jgi:hypothetical protein
LTGGTGERPVVPVGYFLVIVSSRLVVTVETLRIGSTGGFTGSTGTASKIRV